MSVARGRIKELATRLAEAAAPQVRSVVDLFPDELDAYAELILGRGALPFGFMTRGEDASFTERVSQLLRGMGMGDAAVAQHRSLAEWFEHRRAFFKLEWHVGPDGAVEPLAACYFRRRPEVADVLARLSERGLNPAVEAELIDLAHALDKDTVHFVSAAFRPGQPVHHKLYFSQFVTDATAGRVAGRIERVFDLLGGSAAARERFRALHPRHFGPGEEATLFVSVNFTDAARHPSFKIDYPNVPPRLAAEWTAPDDRRRVLDEASAACLAASVTRLSFLGVRFGAGAHPQLKYYVDFPDGTGLFVPGADPGAHGADEGGPPPPPATDV